MIDEKSKRHIKSALVAIERLEIVSKEHSLEEAENDFRISDVLLLEFENLANECMKIDSAILTEFPDFPLEELRAIRNRVAHDYISVSIEILYKTISNDLGKVKEMLDKMAK